MCPTGFFMGEIPLNLGGDGIAFVAAIQIIKGLDDGECVFALQRIIDRLCLAAGLYQFVPAQPCKMLR